MTHDHRGPGGFSRTRTHTRTETSFDNNHLPFDETVSGFSGKLSRNQGIDNPSLVATELDQSNILPGFWFGLRGSVLTSADSHLPILSVLFFRLVRCLQGAHYFCPEAEPAKSVQRTQRHSVGFSGFRLGKPTPVCRQGGQD